MFLFKTRSLCFCTVCVWSFENGLLPSHPPHQSFPVSAFSHRQCYSTFFFCVCIILAFVLLGRTESLSVCLTSSIGMTWAYPPPAAPPRPREEVTQSEVDNGTGTHKGGVLSAGLWVNLPTPTQNVAGYEMLASRWQGLLITQLLAQIWFACLLCNPNPTLCIQWETKLTKSYNPKWEFILTWKQLFRNIMLCYINNGWSFSSIIAC